MQKVQKVMGMATAIVDESNRALVKSGDFDEGWLNAESNGKLFFASLNCPGCDFQIVAKALEKPSFDNKNEELFVLIKENVELLITPEQEAQELAKEVLERYEELNLLYDIISELSIIFDEKKICQIALERAMRVLNVSAGAIFLKDERSDDLSLAAAAENEQMQKILHADKLIEFALESLRYRKEILIDNKAKLPDWYFDNIANHELWSLLSVPISASNKILGSLVLIGKLDDDTFQSGDIKLADAIARYAGITINSNRMVEQMRATEALRHEMRLARNIQQSLLPKSLPENENFEIAGICEPAADVGGDYFGVSRLGNGKWEIVVADVSGHGIGAAMTMASLRSILRSESRFRECVDEVVKNANALMCDDTKDTGMYATMVLARYEETSGLISYCNAGHQIPIVWRSEQNKAEFLENCGLPVGMFEDEEYRLNEINLQRGDFLLLFTDGVTEARDHENNLFGESRLIDVLEKQSSSASAKDILNSVIGEVKEFQHSNLQRDDITIVILKRK